MRQLGLAAFLAALTLAPATSHAQDRKTRQAEKKISVVLTEFNEEMRGYERELKYFQRVPDSRPLFELRKQLIGQAVEMGKLDTAGRGSGPAVLALAREMDRTARKLDAGTVMLEKRAEAVGGKDGRVVAERMRTHADEMVKTIDKMILMFR